MNKYKNKKPVYDGHIFDSQREANRWAELKLMERAGVIKNLRRQVAFELIPTQRDGSGKLLERTCYYIADFVYDKDGETVVEDAKGVKTREYVVKRKLMLWVHNVKIREV